MEGRESFSRRWLSLIVLVLVTVPTACLQPWKNGPPIRSDGEGYHLWTRAFLERDLSFRRHAGESGLFLADPVRRIYQNKYPPGIALLRFPVMAFLVDARPGAAAISRAEHVANVAFSAVVLMLVGFLLLRTCELLQFNASSSHTALLVGVFGTGLFHYGTYDACFSHVYSALGTTLLLWLGVRTVVKREAHLPPLATALTCFLFILFRNTNVLLLLLLTGAYLYARRQRGLLSWKGEGADAVVVAVGAGTAVGLQLVYNFYACGRFTLSSYGAETFVWDQPHQLAVLFSYDRGLFSYYPVVGLILFCAWTLRRMRVAAAWFSLVLLTYVVLYGFWSSWQLGCGFGHRGFIELMPLAVVLFAAALSHLPPRRRVAVTTMALLCTAFTVAFMIKYWRGLLPMSGTTASLYWQKSLLGWLAEFL